MSTTVEEIVADIDAKMLELVPAYATHRDAIKAGLFTAVAEGIYGFTSGTGAWTHRGTWNPLTDYEVNDIVENDGSSYLCLTANTGSEPPSADWELLASRGTDGGTGATGPAGPSNVITEAGGPTDLLVDAIADGEFLKRSGSTVVGATPPSPVPFLYGTGTDSIVDLDGTNTFSFASKSGSTYTLTRDVFGTVITVRAGVTVKTVGFVIHASTSMTIESTGVVHDDGNAGSGATNGSALSASGTLGRSSNAGGTGRTGSSLGANGGSISLNGCGGAGGAGGGTGGAYGGTSGGSVTAPVATTSSIYTPNVLVTGKMLTVTASWAVVQCGAGGGGGSFDPNGGTGGSGGGGGGGGFVKIHAKSWTNNGEVRAKGGNGASAFTTTGSPNGGGGGGGGGGVVILITDNNITLGTISVAGGSAGSGVGTGLSGTAGSAGIYVVVAP